MNEAGKEYFYFRLASGGELFDVGIDTWPGKGWLSGPPIPKQGDTMEQRQVKGQILTIGRPHTIVCKVRKESCDVTCDGKTIYAWKGDFQRPATGWR